MSILVYRYPRRTSVLYTRHEHAGALCILYVRVKDVVLCIFGMCQEHQTVPTITSRARIRSPNGGWGRVWYTPVDSLLTCARLLTSIAKHRNTYSMRCVYFVRRLHVYICSHGFSYVSINYIQMCVHSLSLSLLVLWVSCCVACKACIVCIYTIHIDHLYH